MNHRLLRLVIVGASGYGASMGFQAFVAALVPNGIRSISTEAALLICIAVGLIAARLWGGSLRTYILVPVGVLGFTVAAIVVGSVVDLVNSLLVHVSPWTVGTAVAVVAAVVGAASVTVLVRTEAVGGRWNWILAAFSTLGLATLLQPVPFIFADALDSFSYSHMEWTRVCISLLGALGAGLVLSLGTVRRPALSTEQALQPDASASAHNAGE